MRHFPIFLDMAQKRVVVSGAGETAVAKLRLLLKTEAAIHVFGPTPAPAILDWAAEGAIEYRVERLGGEDVADASLLYCANDDEIEDARVARLAHGSATLVNVVDNLEASQFITPAIVDRSPVTVAIGTEGAAPVLARKIKADIEASLPTSLGVLARIGQAFRGKADSLPMGRIRRDFWSAFYFNRGPTALAQGGKTAVRDTLADLHLETLHKIKATGRVVLVGAGPGDPELLTLKARRVLHEADVVLYDRGVSPEILELARREAVLIPADDANSTDYQSYLRKGEVVAHLHSDTSQLDAARILLEEGDIAHDFIPGIANYAAPLGKPNNTFTQDHPHSLAGDA